MNSECGIVNSECGTRSSETAPARRQAPVHSAFTTHYSLLAIRRCKAAAFTLIEMLTVIAIIGILAAILLPTIRIAMQRAKIAAAKGDLRSIQLALDMYNMEFGAYPPDSNAGLSEAGVDFSDMVSPNECLVWFLTREYSTASDAAGQPWASGSGWNPATSPTVFSRVAFRGGLDLKAKQQRDDDQDGFYEFVDPWGRPYFYRAYPQYWDVSTITDEGSGTFRITLADVQVQDLVRQIGQVRIFDGTDSGNEGTFDIVETGADWLEVSNASGQIEDPSDAYVSFLLHNTQTCDLYSLGPNGKTRAATRPGAQPWNAQSAPADWDLMWGTPGDGNDVAPDRAGNLNVEEGDQDDVNNWSG